MDISKEKLCDLDENFKIKNNKIKKTFKNVKLVVKIIKAYFLNF